MSSILSILFSLESYNCPCLTWVIDIAPITLYFSPIACFPVLFVSYSVSYIFSLPILSCSLLSYLTVFLTGSGTSQGEDTGT